MCKKVISSAGILIIRQTIKALVSTILVAAVAADACDTTHNVQNFLVFVQIFDKGAFNNDVEVISAKKSSCQLEY